MARERQQLVARAAQVCVILTTCAILMLGHLEMRRAQAGATTVLVDSWGYFQDGDYLDSQANAHFERTPARRKAEPVPTESSCE